MNKIWAINEFGKPEVCKAKPENIGKGRCKHNFHSKPGETPQQMCARFLKLPKEQQQEFYAKAEKQRKLNDAPDPYQVEQEHKIRQRIKDILGEDWKPADLTTEDQMNKYEDRFVATSLEINPDLEADEYNNVFEKNLLDYTNNVFFCISHAKDKQQISEYVERWKSNALIALQYKSKALYGYDRRDLNHRVKEIVDYMQSYLKRYGLNYSYKKSEA